jgi:pimeloyl-ACP methyl ester carboxylesterase
MRAIAAIRHGETHAQRSRLLMAMVFLAGIVAASTVLGQTGGKEQPKPRPVTLKTKDGIKLKAYYFPSKKEKEAVTVLLVHEWEGQASPYIKLVLALRDAGCAVLVPDYRGHGGSREYVNARGEVDEFNLATMSKRDIESIIAFDLEKSKAFLIEENNAGKLNLNALVVIGIREGAVMAAHWAQRDWKFPSLGNVKQGQDVKAMVFISPEKQVKGVGIDSTLTDGNLLRLPIMILAGASSPEAPEAERIGKRVEAMKKRMNRGDALGFEMAQPKTKLSGAGFINNTPGVIKAITEFVTSNVVINEEENPWILRR